MKKRWITLLSVFVLVFSLMAFAACGKTEKKATLTLDAGVGTLTQTEYEVTVGTNLAEFLQEVVPTAEGLQFGAWVYNDVLLSQTDVMPENPLTLTAKYLAPYTVETYKEDEDGAYVLDVTATKSASAWYGEEFAPQYEVVNYYVLNETLSTAAKTLDVTSNVFKAYYDSEEYTLAYNANVPQGSVSTGRVDGGTYKHVASVIVADNAFSIKGHRFVGWATTADGAVEYGEGDTFHMISDVTLYAVWQKGYVDVNGGSDYIYVPSNREGVAILERQGLEDKEGMFDKTTGIFYFEEADLRGRISADGTFSYKAEVAASYSMKGDDVTTLELDGFDKATVKEDGEVVAAGTYYLDESGDFFFDNDGDDNYFYFKIEGENFVVRDALYGTYAYVVSGIFANYTFTFDGYGKASTDWDSYYGVEYEQVGEDTFYIYVFEDYGYMTYDIAAFYCVPDEMENANGQTVQVLIAQDPVAGTLNVTVGETAVEVKLDGYGKATVTPAGETAQTVSYSVAAGYEVEDDYTYTTYTYYFVRFNCTIGGQNKEVYLSVLIDENEDGIYYGQSATVIGNEAGRYKAAKTSSGQLQGDLVLHGDGNAHVIHLKYGYEYVYYSGTYTINTTNGITLYTLSMTLDGTPPVVEDVFKTMTLALDGDFFRPYDEALAINVAVGENTYVGDGYGNLIITENGTPRIAKIENLVESLYRIKDGDSVYNAIIEETFTKVGDEAGMYHILESGVIGDAILVLDGQGNAMYSPTGATTDILTGMYAAVNGSIYEFAFTASNPEDSFVFTIGTGTAADGVVYNLFMIADQTAWSYNVSGGGKVGMDAYGNVYYVDNGGNMVSAAVKEEEDTVWNRDLVIVATANGTTTYEKVEGVLFRLGSEYGAYQMLEGIIVIEDSIVYLNGKGNFKISVEGEVAFVGEYVATYVSGEYELYVDGEADPLPIMIQTINTTDGTQALVFVARQEGWWLETFYSSEDWSVSMFDGYGNVTMIDGRGYVAKHPYEVVGESVFRIYVNNEYHYYHLNRTAGTYYEDIEDYVIEGNRLIVYRGDETEIIIPDAITVIGKDAFYFNQKITSVNLKNVTVIEDAAFQDCTSLATITGTGNVIEIGAYAFRECTALSSVVFASVTTIGELAFSRSSALASVKVGNEITSIGDEAFIYVGSGFALEIAAGAQEIAFGTDVFKGATTARVLFANLDEAIAFYATAAGKTYGAHVAVASLLDNDYYTDTMDSKMTLNTQITIDGALLGIYSLSGTTLTVYTADATAASGYVQTTGTMNEGVYTYNGKTYYIAGLEKTYTLEGGTTTFVYKLGEDKAVYNGTEVTLKDGLTFTYTDGYDYTITLLADGKFTETKKFVPVTKKYTDATGTLSSTYALNVTVNNAEGTDVSMSGYLQADGRRNSATNTTWSKAQKLADNQYSIVVSFNKSSGGKQLAHECTIIVTLDTVNLKYVSYESQIVYHDNAVTIGDTATTANVCVTYADNGEVNGISLQVKNASGTYEDVVTTFTSKEVQSTQTVLYLTAESGNYAGTYTVTIKPATTGAAVTIAYVSQIIYHYHDNAVTIGDTTTTANVCVTYADNGEVNGISLQVKNASGTYEDVATTFTKDVQSTQTVYTLTAESGNYAGTYTVTIKPATTGAAVTIVYAEPAAA